MPPTPPPLRRARLLADRIFRQPSLYNDTYAVVENTIVASLRPGAFTCPILMFMIAGMRSVTIKASMQDPPNTFPPPSSPDGTPAATPRSEGYDVFDVVLFFAGFFAMVIVSVALPRTPPITGLITGMGLISLRHRIKPPKARVARQGTTIVGVFVGLAVVSSVALLGCAGLMFARFVEREPDWQVRRNERLLEARRPYAFPGRTPFEPTESEAQRIANEAIADEQGDFANNRRDASNKGMKFTAAGSLFLLVASLAERARTRPVEEVG